MRLGGMPCAVTSSSIQVCAFARKAGDRDLCLCRDELMVVATILGPNRPGAGSVALPCAGGWCRPGVPGCTQGRVDVGPSDSMSGVSEAPGFTKHP